MESVPYGLVLQKKKKKGKKNNKINEENEIKENTDIKSNEDNEIQENNKNEINEINVIKTKSSTLMIKSEMDKCGYYSKTHYFINNKTDGKFLENNDFEKLFPNLTAFFKNLDNDFSLAIENNTYSYKKKEMPKALRNYILDRSDAWNNEIINYIGYYWDSLEKKVKSHTLIFLCMVYIFINKDNLSDYDKNILYWAILFHDVGKFHEMNTIYKEDFSHNKFIDKAHPFKSTIVFIKTVLNKQLLFFNDENEKKEFIEFFEKQFIKTLYESYGEEKDKYDNLIYNINFNKFYDIEKFLLKLKLHKENKWIYEIVLLIMFHQSFPNNNPKKAGKHINYPLLDDKYIKELFDIRLIELMRIILIYDSSSHCLFSNAKWEQEIDKYFNLLIRNNYLEEENKIVYLAELDGDIDDVIAVEYLYSNCILKCIVCDPKPTTKIGIIREQNLKKLGIEIYYEIPEDTDIVFCGGALTTLAKFLDNHKISTLVMNGGFVGDNIVPKNDVLEKFEGQKAIRTFNFNCDVESTDKVLKSSEEKIKKIILVGKNVCHSENNTPKGIWNYEEFDYLFSKYRVKKGKCLHDLLMCHEGLCLLNLLDEEPYCEFEEVYPYNNGLKGEITKWGSTKDDKSTPYRQVLAAVRFI